MNKMWEWGKLKYKLDEIVHICSIVRIPFFYPWRHFREIETPGGRAKYYFKILFKNGRYSWIISATETETEEIRNNLIKAWAKYNKEGVVK